MGMVEQAIVIGVAVDRAMDEWKEFAFRDEVGHGLGPQGDILAGEEDVTAELIDFEELGPDSTRVILKAEFDDDEDFDVSALRADVNDELARFREFVEGRMAA
jgi:hypothetical protein